MKCVERVVVTQSPEGVGTVISFYINPPNDSYSTYAIKLIEQELVSRLVEEYVKLHGDEILKRIQEKTIDAKVIQKVVENLRKELKDENRNA